MLGEYAHSGDLRISGSRDNFVAQHGSPRSGAQALLRDWSEGSSVLLGTGGRQPTIGCLNGYLDHVMDVRRHQERLEIKIGSNLVDTDDPGNPRPERIPATAASG